MGLWRIYYAGGFPGRVLLSVHECDFVIEEIGPTVAQDILRSKGR